MRKGGRPGTLDKVKDSGEGVRERGVCGGPT